MNKCKSCGKNFSFERTLKRHEIKYCVGKTSYCVKCGECDEKFSTQNLFNNHIESIHNFVQENEEREFVIYEEFLKWKQDVESNTRCSYVQNGQYKTKRLERKYFVCHRSGFFISKSTGARRLKKQGTNKMDSSCPSTMVMTRSSGKPVHVIYKKKHFGHTIVGTQPLSVKRKIKKRQNSFEAIDEASETVTELADESKKVSLQKLQKKVELLAELLSTREFQPHEIESMQNLIDSALKIVGKSGKTTSREPETKKIVPQTVFCIKVVQKRMNNMRVIKM